MTSAGMMHRSGIGLSLTAVTVLLLVTVSTALSGCKRVTGTDKPAAPQSLQVTAASSSSVVITWVDASDNETDFVIEMDPYGPAGYAQVGTVEAGVTSYTVTGLNPDDNNRYRVYARGTAGSSEPTPARLYRIYGVTVGHVVEDFSARNQNNALVSLYNYQGNVILLNFAASW